MLIQNERRCSRAVSRPLAITTHQLLKANALMTLLIVDDNREMRQLMKSIVSEVCDQVFECEDGDEVLPAFDTHRPDWVLMDVEMKRRDGLRATSDLMNRYPEARVIIVTKHADIETRRRPGRPGRFFWLARKTCCHCCR